ncbi:MAG: protein kinase [Myxococcales bacterium]|nr:protein kinase [Myxococcales bacterium]
MACLDDDEVAAWASGTTPRADRDRVAAHLLACPACRELVAGAADTAPVSGADVPGAPLAAGAVIDGRFVLEAVVGEGGMATVWRARDRSAADRVVALKLLRGLGVQVAQRLFREAEILRAFSHPGVVRAYDAFATHGDVVLVMDLVVGESLGQRLARDGRLAWREAARVTAAVAGALSAAHERGIVHRDVKPGNVMLRADGAPILVDFGLAKALDPLALANAGWRTSTGSVLGTPAYMAPEQLHGERDIDGRADVWALGAVLYECLAGQRPFAGRGIGRMLRDVLRPPSPLGPLAGDAPATLVDAAMSALTFDRSARPGMRDLAARLSDVGAG